MKKSQLTLALTLLLLAQAAVPYGASAAGSKDWDDQIKEGVSAYNHGNFKEAQNVFNRLMNEGAKKYGAFDARMGRVYTNLGEAYNGEGNYYWGSVYLKRGLDIREKAYGVNALELVPSLNGLALALVGQRKSTEAEPLYRRALSIAEAAGQKGLGYVGIVDCNMGQMYYGLGKYKEAIVHFKRGCPIVDQLFGSDHDFTLNAVKLYSTCLKSSNQEEQAKTVEESAIMRAREVTSPMTQWEKNFYEAQALADAGKYKDSMRLYRRALEWAENLPDKIPLVVTLTRYAKVCQKDGNNVEALTLLQRAQPISEQAMGEDDPQVIKHALELADLEREQGRYQDAEPLYLKVVVYQKKEFGPDSAPMREALGKLGANYQAWGAYPKAVKVWERTLATDEKNYGTKDPRLAPTLEALGDAYRDDLAVDQAEACYKRAVALLESAGDKKPEGCDLPLLLEHFSVLYQRRSIWEKAEPLMVRAVALREKDPGPDNADLVRTLESYATFLRAASKRDRAEPIEARIAALKNKTQAAAAATTTKDPADTASGTSSLDKALQ